MSIWVLYTIYITWWINMVAIVFIKSIMLATMHRERNQCELDGMQTWAFGGAEFIDVRMDQ